MVLRDVVAAISRAKDEMADRVLYRALANSMRDAAGGDEDRAIAAAKCLEIADIYDLYEEAKTRHGGVDFGDLIALPAKLLETDAALRTAVQLRHRHILVDEYQDVNRASARLLKAVAGGGERLWVVGDSRQSIYRFRGASSANLARFTADYPGGSVDQLGVNYRSTDQVVSTLVAIAPHMSASQGMLPLALQADRGSGPSRPEIRRFETLDDEAAGLPRAFANLRPPGCRCVTRPCFAARTIG